MKERPWLKWVGIGLCIVVAVAMFFICTRVREKNQKEREALRAMAEEYEVVLRPLWEEKARLEREISEQEKLVGEEAPPTPIVLLCTEARSQLLNDVYPLLKQYAYPAVVVVSESAILGDAEYLTKEDMQDLVDQGWELCLEADSGTDLEALYQKMIDEDLPKPIGVYYPADDGTKEQEEQIRNLGISTVIYYSKKLKEDQAQANDLWYLSAFGSSEDTAKTTFDANTQGSVPMALTVGYSRNRERYEAENYSSMLKVIRRAEEGGTARVLTIQAARSASVENQIGGTGGQETEEQKKLRELKERLAEVNERIWESGQAERFA